MENQISTFHTNQKQRNKQINMKVYKFKTNINCSGCVAGVTPFLNRVENIRWEVDTNNPDKILTIETDTASEDEIMRVVKKAGFDIEEVKNS